MLEASRNKTPISALARDSKLGLDLGLESPHATFSSPQALSLGAAQVGDTLTAGGQCAHIGWQSKLYDFLPKRKASCIPRAICPFAALG